MNIRSSSSHDDTANMSIKDILRDIQAIDSNIVRSDGAEKALANKGMTKKHWNRTNHTEENGLAGAHVFGSTLLLELA